MGYWADKFFDGQGAPRDSGWPCIWILIPIGLSVVLGLLGLAWGTAEVISYLQGSV